MDSSTNLYLASVLSNTLRVRRSGGKGKGGRSSGGYSQRAGGRRRGERRPKQRRRPGRVGDPATSDPPRRRPASVHLKRRRAGEKRGLHRRQVLERRRGRWVAGGEGGELRAAARALGIFRSGGWGIRAQVLGAQRAGANAPNTPHAMHLFPARWHLFTVRGIIVRLQECDFRPRARYIDSFSSARLIKRVCWRCS